MLQAVKADAMGPRHTTLNIKTVAKGKLEKELFHSARLAESSGWFYKFQVKSIKVALLLYDPPPSSDSVCSADPLPDHPVETSPRSGFRV